MPALLAQAAYESQRVLAGLLAEVPRLHKELPGWVVGYLTPALDAFPNDATDAQIATALFNLRKVLRERAAIDPWLGDIANLGTGEYARDPHAMTLPSELKPRIALSPEPIGQRTVVELARQLRVALVPMPTTEENRSERRSAAAPDVK
jgi:hypothetical protein